MEMSTSFALKRQGLAGWGVSVLLVSGVAGGGLPARRLAALGARVMVQESLDRALDRLLGDWSDGPRAIGLLVIDCDHAGGGVAGQQAFDLLARAGLRLPVMLICSACPEQTFPVGRVAPYRLRAPVSAVALRIAFELAFADQFGCAGQGPSGSAPDAPEKGRSRGGAPFRI